MSNELKNSWRWRHARSLFLPLILCTIALLVSIAIEIFIYQTLWVLIAEVSLILFILGNLVKLYIQYRKLPHGSKRKMIRTIEFLEDILPLIIIMILAIEIFAAIRTSAL